MVVQWNDWNASASSISVNHTVSILAACDTIHKVFFCKHPSSEGVRKMRYRVWELWIDKYLPYTDSGIKKSTASGCNLKNLSVISHTGRGAKLPNRCWHVTCDKTVTWDGMAPRQCKQTAPRETSENYGQETCCYDFSLCSVQVGSLGREIMQGPSWNMFRIFSIGGHDALTGYGKNTI